MPEPMIDLFNDDAFSVASLTGAINDITYVPGRLAKLGLFATQNLDVTIASYEKKGDLLVLVPPSPRGGPGTTVQADPGRTLRPFVVPHFEINDFVKADSVQNVRAFGSATQLMTLVGKVAGRMATHVNSFAATEEYARIGAVKGIITYADGSTLDLFAEFGVSQEAEIDFDLDNGNPTPGALRKKCAGITRKMQDILGGVPFTGIHVLCGDNFFDDVLSHPEVRATYDGWGDAKILREGYIGPNRDNYPIFDFGGLIFENYRGAVGSTSFIDADKCHLFPLGVPGLFDSVYSPADYEETVNTIAKRLYAKQYSSQNGKGRHLDVQMNALQICTRPKTLMKGRRT
jgi:hypothetical protein